MEEKKRQEDENKKLAEIENKKKEEEERKRQAEEAEKKKIDNQYTLGVSKSQFINGFNSALKTLGVNIEGSYKETDNNRFDIIFSSGKDKFDGIIAKGIINNDGTIRALYFLQDATKTDPLDLRYTQVFMYTTMSVVKAIDSKLDGKEALEIFDSLSNLNTDKNNIHYEMLKNIRADGDVRETSVGSFFVRSIKDNTIVEINKGEMEFVQKK